MTRLRPANIRQTSGTLCYAYDGISNYYYSNQLKQNLANANALKTFGQKLILPTTPFKRGKLHTLQPASLPMSIQLRTQKTMKAILLHSRHWLLNKAQNFASVLMPSKIPKVFEMMAGLNLKIPDKHFVLEHAIFAVIKNFENLSHMNSNKKHVHMRKKQILTKTDKQHVHTRKKQILTKLYKQHLKGFFLAKACGVQKENELNQGLSHKNKMLKPQKKQKLLSFLNHNHLTFQVKRGPKIVNSSNSHLNINSSQVYKQSKPLLHPMGLLRTKLYFNHHPKQNVMNFALAYLATKTYDNKSKRLIGPRLAAMHIEKSRDRQSRKKQARYYDFQFLKQLNKNAPLKLGFVSPLSQLSVAINKRIKAKDPWLMLSSSNPFYLANRKKQNLIKQQQQYLMDAKNVVFKTRDVPQRFHPNHNVDISQAEQKAIDTIDPRFTTLGRFNRPLKLGLFTFITGKFPMGIKQGYRLSKPKTQKNQGYKFSKRKTQKNRHKAYKKTNQKHNRVKVNRNLSLTDLKLTPLSYDLRHSDVLKVGLTRLNTAIRFELTLNLEQAEKPVRLRSTLSVRL